MLHTALPLVGFVTPIKKSWEDGQEKKKRTVKLDPDEYFRKLHEPEEESDEGSEEDDDDLSSLGSSYVSSKSSRTGDGSGDEDEDFLDDYAGFVNTLLPKEGEMGGGIAKFEASQGPPKKEKKIGVFGRAWDRFMTWRELERERRKHHVFREYEERVRRQEDKLRSELEQEITAIRLEVEREAVKLHKRRMINSMAKPKSKYDAMKQATARYDALVEKRDEEFRRMEFYYLHLQSWAVEKHDQKIRDEELKQFRIKEEQQKAAEKARLEAAAKAKLDDALILAEDIRITQEWKEMGRRVGVLAGVNVPVKLEVVKDEEIKGGFRAAPRASKLRLGIKHDFDHRLLLRRRDPNAAPTDDDDGGGKSAAQRKREQKSRKPYTPFDQDLSRSAHVLELKCQSIGERGALSLAAELLRGACQALETLDLSRCQIQTRGLGRLLHGIKLSNLMSLRHLLLRGNDIGPRGIEYLQLTYSSGCLIDLKVLDLRENEIGDEGADRLMRMVISGYLINLEQLHLQWNNIGDKGFVKLVKVLQSMAGTKCPRLERLGMENNPISSAVKRQYSPLAAYWSL